MMIPKFLLRLSLRPIISCVVRMHMSLTIMRNTGTIHTFTRELNGLNPNPMYILS